MTPVIAGSVSYYEVLRKLGLVATGSANTRIREIVKKLGLDTSHFLGRGANRGPDKMGGNKRLLWETVLVRDRHGDGRKENVKVLRQALIDSGVEERCEECGLGPEWKDKPLRLQIDHRNGDCIDNASGNPRFLCPNCHAQTPTFGSKNRGPTTGWKKPKSGKKRVRKYTKEGVKSRMCA